MIQCKPKMNTYIALGMVLATLIGGLIYILHHFATYRTFGLFYYLFATVLLTVVILLLLVKMMAAYKFISASTDTITVRLPLRGMTKNYKTNQVLVWDEEIVNANKKEFRQTTIVFEDKSSFTLSNHEHVNYSEFVGFLQKKAPKKKAPK